MVRMAGELLEQSVVRGSEVVNGFKIFENKGLVRTTFQRNILLLEAEIKGGSPQCQAFANKIHLDDWSSDALTAATVEEKFAPRAGTR
jgi:hypothetical protein